MFEDFNKSNAELVRLVREELEPVGVVRKDHFFNVELVTYFFSGGRISWGRSMPWNYPFGGGDSANLNKPYVSVMIADVHLHVGVNGAFVCPREGEGYFPGKSREALSHEVLDILNQVFQAVAEDLAIRSLAGVATALRGKSVGFSAFKKMVDAAQGVLRGETQ